MVFWTLIIGSGVFWAAAIAVEVVWQFRRERAAARAAKVVQRDVNPSMSHSEQTVAKQPSRRQSV